jgi:peptidoglycan hydrolase-like protein with peptidoglycan-binding domain
MTGQVESTNGDRLLAARGARGELVTRAQRRLAELGFDPRGVDGVYGQDTAAAIEAFQQARGLPPTGALDPVTWQALMGTAAPNVRDRALQVTAAFEGHGFGLAQGNWDGAGITWGIVGFTLKHGELGRMVLRLHQERPDLLEAAFGSRTGELVETLGEPRARQIAWADGISLGARKERLAEPWRSAFARLGAFDEVQAMQLTAVDRDYFQPSLETARRFDLRTELGLALAFDIHVQNGGIASKARLEIEGQRADHPLTTEQELRVIVAHAVAANSRAEFREDVLARKLTLATGSGRVHGAFYALRNWGLGELEVHDE